MTHPSFEVKEEAELRRLKVITEFREYEPVYMQLPISVPNGGVIKEFKAVCGMCEADIEPDNFRGNFGSLSPEGPVLLNAHLYCKVCNAYTPYSHRVKGRRGKLTSEYQNERGEWVWSEWKTPVGGVIKLRLASWLERFFH